MTTTMDAELSQMQARARRQVVRVLRDAFFDELARVRSIERLNPMVGVVVAHPLPASLGGGVRHRSPGGYLLSTQEFWFQGGPWLDKLVSFAAEGDEAKGLRRLLDAVLSLEQTSRAPKESALRAARRVAREHADAVSVELPRVRDEVRESRATALRWVTSKELDPADPALDPARRLVALRRTHAWMTPDQEWAVLVTEALVLRVWARLPQIGGYGAGVLQDVSTDSYLPLARKAVEEVPEALALQLLEDALFYRVDRPEPYGRAPLFSASLLQSRSAKPLGYIFTLTDSVLPDDEGAAIDRPSRMAEVLHRVADRVGPFVQNLFDQELIVALSTVRGLPAEEHRSLEEISRLCTPVLGARPEGVALLQDQPRAIASLLHVSNGATYCILPAYEASFRVDIPNSAHIRRAERPQLEVVLTQLQMASHAARAAFRDDMTVLAHLFSHELGRRLVEIAPGQVDLLVRDATPLDANGEDLLRWARGAAARIHCLHGFTELARWLFKSGRGGVLPKAWLHPSCRAWPAVDIDFAADAWLSEVRSHLEDIFLDYHVDLRCAVGEGNRRRRLLPFVDWDPNVASTQAPRIFLLAPILEMAANAVAHVRQYSAQIPDPRIAVELLARDCTLSARIGNTCAATPWTKSTPHQMAYALARFGAFTGPRQVEHEPNMVWMEVVIDLRKLRFTDHQVEDRTHG